MTLADQIVTDLEEALAWWQGLLGPDVVDLARQRIRERAPMWAGQLTSGDDRLAAETVQDLMGVLGPRPDSWWTTPLGQAVARSTGSPLSELVSYSVAGAMLGVSRARIQQLVEAGRLDTGDGGSIVAVSVLDEAMRRSSK